MSSRTKTLPRHPLSFSGVDDEDLLNALTVSLLKEHFPLPKNITSHLTIHKALRIRLILRAGLTKEQRTLARELVSTRWRTRHSPYILQLLDARSAANRRRASSRRARSQSQASSSGSLSNLDEKKAATSQTTRHRLVLSHIDMPPRPSRKVKQVSSHVTPDIHDKSTSAPLNNGTLGSVTTDSSLRRSSLLLFTKTVDISISDILLKVGIPLDNLLDADDGDDAAQSQLEPEDLRVEVGVLLDDNIAGRVEGDTNGAGGSGDPGTVPMSRVARKIDHKEVTMQSSSSRADFKKERSALRAQQHIDNRRISYTSTVDITATAKTSAYRGHRTTAVDQTSATIVPMEDGMGAEIYDCRNRLVLYRAFSPKRTARWTLVNDLLTTAAGFLENIRPCSTGGPRGNFKKYYFGLHRGSAKNPMMSASYRNHKDSIDTMLHDLEPVRSFCEGIFRQVFPRVYERYTETMDFVQQRMRSSGTEVHALFYPWAAIGMNVGAVVSLRHKDYFNYLPGLCLIIPFLLFDHTKGARLVVVELGLEFEIAAGIPILIPSACFTHYNTILEEAGVRNSFTAWTDGSIFLWRDLNGRSFSDLSVDEQQDFKRSMAERVARGFDLFPRRIVA